MRKLNNIITRASARANLIHKCFVSKEVSLLCRAFTVYVRPLLEYASCVWSHHLIKDIERLERVQRRFTKRLRGLSTLTYKDRLQVLGLQSLESRRLQFDLIYAYKILTGMIDIYICFHPTVIPVHAGPRLQNLPSWLSDRLPKILFRPTCYSSTE